MRSGARKKATFTRAPRDTVTRALPGYIVFEGIDGAGKSTQLKIMAERLRALDITPVELCEPTYGKFGAAMRDAMAAGLDMPVSEQAALFTADRRDHVRSRIRPLLSLIRGRGKPIAILQHRHYLSAPVYQWLNDHQATSLLRAQQAIAPRPDLVLLLDISGRLAHRRIRRRDVPAGRAAAKDLETLRGRYLRFARASGETVVIVDGSGAPAAVAARLWGAVQEWAKRGERRRQGRSS